MFAKRWQILQPRLTRHSPKIARKHCAKNVQQKYKRFSKTRSNRLAAAVKANLGKPVIHADELNFAMAQHLEPNSIVVSENLTGKCDSFKLGFRDDEMMWVSNTGHSLGWGLGAVDRSRDRIP